MNLKGGQLFKRKNSASWQLRIYIPKDVQGFGAPKEIVESMRTSDWAEACQRAGARLLDKRAEWESLRNGGAVPAAAAKQSNVPTEEELLVWGADLYRKARRFIADRRSERQSASPADYLDFLIKEEGRMPVYVRELASDNLDRWSLLAEVSLGSAGYDVDRASPEFAKAVKICAEMMIAARDVENRRDRGELNAKPSSEVLDKAESAAAHKAATKADMPFSKLERFPQRLNREGFHRRARSDSESVLVKEAGMDGQSTLAGFA